MKRALRFYECGCCGHFHLDTWYGDCREDDNRYTHEEMEEKAINETGEMPDYVTEEEQIENDTERSTANDR